MTARRASGLVLESLPTILAVIAEAAWVAVLAALLQAFALHPGALAYPWFLAATFAGLAATRALEHRAGERWPLVVAALAIAAGALGWLASADVRAILAGRSDGGLVEALGANIGGWLVAVAFVRGVAHARVPADPHRIGNMLALAIPGLAAVAIIGGMAGEPHRSAFLAEAQAEVLVFLVAGILALALARLGLVATGAAVDWRRNPAWLALLVALLAATAMLALAIALFGGQVIVMALGALFTPLLIVGFFAGFGRRSLSIVAFSVFVAAFLASFLSLLAKPQGSTPPLAPQGPVIALPPDPVASAPVTFGVLGVTLAVAVIAVLLLARLWLKRVQGDLDDVPETREIDRGDSDLDARHGPRRSRFGRRPAPHDAVAAYRALLADLDSHPALRRDPGETPAEHAARLRGAGHGALALDLLAADYGLARYGERPLTPGEHRRALARAKLLRRRLPAG